MTRVDYYDDAEAPAANSLVPAASVVAVGESGAVLFHRRSDSGYWSIPGGRQEPGESVRECAIREAKEETGYDVEIVSLVGIYSDPRRVVAYADGEVRQEFSVCLAGRVVGGASRLSDESLEVSWFHPDELERVRMHDPVRLRVQHYLEHRAEPYIT